MGSAEKNGGAKNGGTGEARKPKESIGAKLKRFGKNTWVWLTTSKPGKVAMAVGGTGLIGLGAKVGFDRGFEKGVASVVPTTIYVHDEPADEPEEPAPEDEPVEETAE